MFVTLSTQANSVFRLLWWIKIYGLLVSWGCLLVRIVWWIVRISSFCPKFRNFAHKKVPHVGLQENEFWPIWNTKMNVTDSYSPKSRLKMVICPFFIYPFWVMVLKNMSAKVTDSGSTSYLFNALRILKLCIVFCCPKELKFVVFSD